MSRNSLLASGSARNAPAPAFDRKAPVAELLGAPLEHRFPARDAERCALALLDLESRAEDARQIADVLGDEEIVLHEALDAARAAMVRVAHAPPDFALHVEGEPVFGPPRDVVQMAAHAREELLALVELGRLVGREDALQHEIGHLVDAVNVFADPEQRVQIAQAAFAVLHVGLEHVARVARALVALAALVELGLDEVGGRRLGDLGEKALLELEEQLVVAPQIAALEQGRADRVVLAREAQALFDRARGMPHFQPQVPQEIEHELDQLLDARAGFVGPHEQQIDVRLRGKLGTPVAADGRDRHALGRRRIGQRIDVAVGEVVDEPHDLVDQERARAHGLAAAGGAALETAADFRAARVQRGFKHVAHCSPPLLGLARKAQRKRFEFRVDRAPIENGALVRDFLRCRCGQFVDEFGGFHGASI
jgi:hypothetical protein